MTPEEIFSKYYKDESITTKDAAILAMKEYARQAVEEKDKEIEELKNEIFRLRPFLPISLLITRNFPGTPS